MMGGVVAVLLHAALVPVWGMGLAQGVGRRPAVPPKEDRPLPTPPELEAGRAHASVSNIAWIPYDDFRELLAKHSIVEQPALQKQEDPAPQAPIEMDPTPPAPTADPQARPTLPAPGAPGAESGGSESMSLPLSANAPVTLPVPQETGQMPYAPKGPIPKNTQAVVPDAPEQAQDSPSKQRADDPGAPAHSDKPTAAPRDDRESPPVTIIPGVHKVRPGEVLTGDGLEIKTVVPRPSIIAQLSAIPRNPEATLWFNPKGEVARIELTRSTGADNWDDPVIAALEQWTASGERIDELQGELRFKVKLLLSRE